MADAELCRQIKEMIIETLKLTDVHGDQIGDDEMLFESELLGLDSLDGLELVIAIQKTFGVAITDQHHAVTILQTVNSIAEFIVGQQAESE